MIFIYLYVPKCKKNLAGSGAYAPVNMVPKFESRQKGNLLKNYNTTKLIKKLALVPIAVKLLTLIKMHVNSVISTQGAQYMTLDVKNFYLNMLMTRYKYVPIKIDDNPEEIIIECNLRDKVASNGHVYVEIRKGMYGLPQAGILAQLLLE